MNSTLITTVLGAVAAIILAIQPIIDATQGQPLDWKQLAGAAIVALFGYLTKGREKPADPTPGA